MEMSTNVRAGWNAPSAADCTVAISADDRAPVRARALSQLSRATKA